MDRTARCRRPAGAFRAHRRAARKPAAPRRARRRDAFRTAACQPRGCAHRSARSVRAGQRRAENIAERPIARFAGRGAGRRVAAGDSGRLAQRRRPAAGTRGELPVQPLQLDAQGAATDTAARRTAQFRDPSRQLPRKPSGGLSGSGRWEGERWSLDAVLRHRAGRAGPPRAPPLVLQARCGCAAAGGLPTAAPATAAPAGGVTPLSVDATGKLSSRLVPPKGAGPTA